MHTVTSTIFPPRWLSSLVPERRQKHADVPSTLPAPEDEAEDSDSDEDSKDESTPSDDNKTLSSLPPELHHMIASHLTYPDLLSLKLADQYFSTLITPKLNVMMRVDWVQSRYAQYLPVPKSTNLSFKSDDLFVGNVEVSSILRRRRKHSECVEYDKDHQKAFKNPIIALELDGHGRMQYIQVRGRIRPSWSKACLITGEPVCPRIEELEIAKQRYENSFVGRACWSVRAVAWGGFVVWWWLNGVWQSNIRFLRRRRQQG